MPTTPDEPPDLYGQTWFAVIRVRHVMRASMEALKVLEPLGLTLRTYTVLAAACTGRRMSQREVAEYVLLDERSVVHLIAELEQLSFVERQPDARDRRVRVVSPTPTGTEAYSRARDAMVEREREALAGLSHAERLMLVELLDKIRGG